ncbi:MAG: PAS domain S-box protein [Gammaproteobacteria bacterium]|nr:PAS domain S-box protein [Gammaproteobacteria bacterium]
MHFEFYYLSIGMLLAAIVTGPIPIFVIGAINITGLSILAATKSGSIITESEMIFPILFQFIITLLLAGKVHYQRHVTKLNNLALTKRSERIDMLMNSTSEAIYGVDLEGNCTFANNACAKLIGYKSPDALLGKNMHRLVHHSKSDGTPIPLRDCHIHAATLNGQSLQTEELFWRLDGTSFPVQFCSSPIFSKDQLVGSVVTLSDISDKKAINNELEQSRARFEVIFESIPDSVIFADENQSIRLVNNATKALFGYTKTDLIGKNLNEFLSNADTSRRDTLNKFSHHTNTLFATYRASYAKRDGSVFTAETTTTPMRTSSGKNIGHITLIRDVSDRAYMDNVMHSLASGRGGSSVKQFLQQSLEQINSLFHSQLAYVGRFENENSSISIKAAKGEANLSLEIQEFPSAGSPELNILESQQSIYCSESSKKFPESLIMSQFHIEDYFATPIISSDGNTVGVLAIASQGALQLPDWGAAVLGVYATRMSVEMERCAAISELKEHQDLLETKVKQRTQQLEHAQGELLRREKLSTLGQLTATVSHELRNPLGAMRPALYLLNKNLDKDSQKLQKAITLINRNIDRCDHIVDELLDFTRTGNLQIHSHTLDPWVSKLVSELTENSGVELHCSLGFADEKFFFDDARLQRAIINIVENAIQAMTTSSNTVERAPTLSLITRAKEDRLEIVVADNGPGMDEKTRSRMFEPLFSTKSFGVGLGMSIVKSIMNQHQGDIEIETQLGQGTTIILWIPMSFAKADDMPTGLASGSN